MSYSPLKETNSLALSVTLFCTLADFHLYMSHQIWIWQRLNKQTNENPTAVLYVWIVGCFSLPKEITTPSTTYIWGYVYKTAGNFLTLKTFWLWTVLWIYRACVPSRTFFYKYITCRPAGEKADFPMAVLKSDIRQKRQGLRAPIIPNTCISKPPLVF